MTMLTMLPEALAITRTHAGLVQAELLEHFAKEIANLRKFPVAVHGTGERGRRLEYYDGTLRIVDGAGNIVADGLDRCALLRLSSTKTVEPWSYLKSPYYKPWAIRRESTAWGRWRG